MILRAIASLAATAEPCPGADTHTAEAFLGALAGSMVAVILFIWYFN